MPESDADRNLLYGLLALQNRFVDQADLIAAFHEWTGDKTRTVGDVLIRRGLLAVDEQALLDALVRKHLKTHGGDTRRSLAAVGSVGLTEVDLDAVADPDLHDSLAFHYATLPDGVDLGHTRTATSGARTGPAGRFRILRPHARGGLGEVSVAKDEELGREVALKQLREHLADDPLSRLRFVREAEITGGLEHPGVVPVYGLGHDSEGRPYYAMRLIQGESLKRAITRFHQDGDEGRDPGERGLTLRRLLRHLLDVCGAVEYAHSRGVLH
ncbi:MAG: protein kinase, partial [Planctomycetia bacterium]|nr:protein kinase [Planctomycetia bacterium]